MTITFLGQAGFLIECVNGLSVVVDPYLSNSLFLQKGELFDRCVPVNSKMLELRPNLLLITHSHADHLDMDSVSPMLDVSHRIDVMGPLSVYRRITDFWPAKHNVLVSRPGVEHMMGQLTVKVVPAFHEQGEEVGYLLKAEGKTVYFSGDTLYSSSLINHLGNERIDLGFFCINGMGNNMNAQEASRLASELNPGLAVPIHWDMFKEFGADPQTFVPDCPHRVIQAYEKLTI